tara:strand:- start:6813 stop:7433 length:621 start_codon:yes stop_codon:yes gene_type:complete
MNNKKITLTEIFDEEGGDKGSYFTHKDSTENLAHNYTKVYDEVMSPFRDEEINLMEIGLWCPFFPGSSVKAWSRYFSKATYYGVDIVDCTQLASEGVNIDIMDQRNEKQMSSYIKDKPKFKFIIDDGCHEEDAIILSLGSLFPHLESGGMYFIEDLHVVDKTNLYNLVTNKFTSEYISEDKIKYINENVDRCYFSEDGKLCVIYKK